MPVSLPLTALLPDLWTVYLGDRPVSQHATLKLASLQATALCFGGQGARVVPPEHSPVVVAKAREAIRKAQERAQLQADDHSHHVHCECCGLWHDMDKDCPPVRRGWGGFDGSQEP